MKYTGVCLTLLLIIYSDLSVSVVEIEKKETCLHSVKKTDMLAENSEHSLKATKSSASQYHRRSNRERKIPTRMQDFIYGYDDGGSASKTATILHIPEEKKSIAEHSECNRTTDDLAANPIKIPKMPALIRMDQNMPSRPLFFYQMGRCIYQYIPPLPILHPAYVKSTTFPAVSRHISYATQPSLQNEKRLTRAAAGESKNGFFCPIIGCHNKQGYNKSFSTALNWWDHIKAVHLKKTYSNRARNTHDLGEKVLGEQHQIVCKVDECREKSFDNFSSLAVHLKEAHGNIIDTLPFNKKWAEKLETLKVELNTKLNPENNKYLCQTCSDKGNAVIPDDSDQALFSKLLKHKNQYHRQVNKKRNVQDNNVTKPLSLLPNKYLGKRYQTRHGNGFLCTVDNIEINQTPEALGQHWLTDHYKEHLYCPVEHCQTSDNVFEKITHLYQHLISHSTAPDNKQALMCGWLTENQLCRSR